MFDNVTLTIVQLLDRCIRYIPPCYLFKFVFWSFWACRRMSTLPWYKIENCHFVFSEWTAVTEQETAKPLPASLEQNKELYTQIQNLQRQGVALRDIAKSLGVCVNTAMKYASLPEPPAKQIRSSRKTSGFEQYIKERWDEGTRGPKQLFLELKKRGYKGFYQTIARYVAELRGPTCSHRRSHEAPALPTPKIAVSKAAFLMGKQSEKIKRGRKENVQHFCQMSDHVKDAYELAQSFQKMVRDRLADELENWLCQAENCIAPKMHSFAACLKRDHNAVKMALSHPLSNGQVEGQNNRLKLINRKMQGRANLDLLKRRVMYNDQIYKNTDEIPHIIFH